MSRGITHAINYLHNISPNAYCLDASWRHKFLSCQDQAVRIPVREITYGRADACVRNVTPIYVYMYILLVCEPIFEPVQCRIRAKWVLVSISK